MCGPRSHYYNYLRPQMRRRAKDGTFLWLVLSEGDNMRSSFSFFLLFLATDEEEDGGQNLPLTSLVKEFLLYRWRRDMRWKHEEQWISDLPSS